jgi:hypothetical protein
VKRSEPVEMSVSIRRRPEGAEEGLDRARRSIHPP